MKNIKENDYKIHIKILYFLILLLFLLVLVLSFIFMYLLQHSNIRMASPVSEVGNMKSRTSNNEDDIINQNTIGHQAKKREVSSETEKDCQGNCSLTPNPSEINDSTINIKGDWNVQKADLLEYCFTADDLCGRNREISKDEEKDNFGGEKQQENKNCILQNFTDDDAFQYRIVNFRFQVDDNSRKFCNIEEGPKDNFKITSKTVFTRYIQQFQVNENGEVKILKDLELPKEMSLFEVIEYNGYIYGRDRDISKKRIVKYNIETGKLTFGDKLDFRSYPRLYFLHGNNFFWALDRINTTRTSQDCFDKLFVAYKIDLDNLKVSSKLNFTLNNCLSNRVFITHDKPYIVTHRPGKIYITSALNNKEFVYFDVQPNSYYNERFLYNPKEQNLYLHTTDDEQNYKILVKKLHFNCSNED
ncbi:uncharacterized protein LOC111637491 isoform X2 [Centruroides sculpturatus]|uniref:uncharacterized protein LOC111637491 isoform X2 n=1 Tax=Centruroides sculpturatus TaxID=218467 RepID=UPI000C6DE49B|nr:uncharacterized protein LOC111637491 isoform X2 [Centruroides sculpturatus]